MNVVSVEIREAMIEDLETLLIFEQEVIRYERSFTSSLKKDPITYYDIQDLMERKDAQLVVAMIEGNVVGSGYALIQSSKPYKKPAYYAYLGFMYVLPKYRGKGVNGKIIEHLIDWTKKQEITEVQLDVYAENESALQAYTKKGFTSDLLKMKLNLEK